MSYYVEMPRYGANMEEGTIGEWLVQDGESVKKGEPVCMIEIEKLTNELLAEEDGVLRHLMDEGETASCGTVIASVAAEGEILEPIAGHDVSAEEKAVVPESMTAVPVSVLPPAARGNTPSGELPADVSLTPKAFKLWEEMGQPVIAGIQGSGYGGKVTREDLRAFAGSAPAIPPVEVSLASPAPVATEPPAGAVVSASSSAMTLVMKLSLPAALEPAAVAYAALKSLDSSPSLRVFEGASGKEMNSQSTLCTIVDGDEGEGAFLLDYQGQDRDVLMPLWSDLRNRTEAGLLQSPGDVHPAVLRFYDASSQGIALFQPGLNGLGGLSLTLGASQAQMEMGKEGILKTFSSSLCLTVDSVLVSRKSAMLFLNRLEGLLKESC